MGDQTKTTTTGSDEDEGDEIQILAEIFYRQTYGDDYEEEVLDKERESTSGTRHSSVDVGGTRADFVLVWSGSSASQKDLSRRATYEKHLEEEGLILRRAVVKSNNLHFIKITAPFEVLQRYAEIMKIQMPIKQIPGVVYHRKLFNALGSFRESKFYKCFFKQSVFIEKSHRFTAAYTKQKQYLFDIDENNVNEYFTPALRSRIVHFIMGRKKYSKDRKDVLAFGFERLVNKEVYKAAYPLHDGEYKSTSCQRGLLFKHWARLSNLLKYQPLDAVRNYFGAKVAVYYAWLGFYIKMLIIPSFLGVLCLVYGIMTMDSDPFSNEVCSKGKDITMCPLCDKGKDPSICNFWKLNTRCKHSKFAYLFDNESTPVFALIMSLWTVIYLEFWKRYSAELNYRWDLTSYDEKDQLPRPEYLAKINNKKSKGKHLNVVTNTVEPSLPFWTMKVPYSIFSISSVLVLVCIALAAGLGVIIYRLAVVGVLAVSNGEQSLGLMLVNLTAALINLCFILCFSHAYTFVATKLTELEIPRTRQEWLWSYSLKIYLLEFINHYGSLFYIAFFKGKFVGDPHSYIRVFGKWRQEECEVSCMPELCIQLAVIMVGKQALLGLFEYIVPYIRKICRRKFKGDAVAQEKIGFLNHQMVRDYELLHFDNDYMISEYLEMVLQYGFVTIFVAAFPIAPLFALLNNLFEIRLDAQKMIKYYRRPVSLRVKGIDVWYTIMDAVAKIATVSNAFIIALTSNFIPKYVYRYFIHDPTERQYGTLHGFLKHTLTEFATVDFDRNRTSDNVEFCSFPAYRYDHTHPKKYDHKDTHWKVWLGRIAFVLIFENVVAVCFLLLRWAIPDVPEELALEIQRQDYLTNELIIQQELLRTRGIKSDMECFQEMSKEELAEVDNYESLDMPQPQPQEKKKRSSGDLEHRKRSNSDPERKRSSRPPSTATPDPTESENETKSRHSV